MSGIYTKICQQEKCVCGRKMLQFIYYSEIIILFCSNVDRSSFIFIYCLKIIGHCFSLDKTKKQIIYVWRIQAQWVLP